LAGENRRKEETRLSGEIAMSIENLYRSCRLRKVGGAGQPVLTQLDRLLAVEEKLVDMRDVIARAEKARDRGDGIVS
jgi:hypothetical protein